MSKATNQFMEEIVNQLIEDMQNGGNWVQGWSIPHRLALQSFVSKKPYRGMNVFLLGRRAKEKDYQHPYWLTFNQAKNLGGKIRSGEKGTKIVLWKVIDVEPEVIDIEEGAVPAMMRRGFFTTHTVFNIEQTEGIEYSMPILPELTEIERNQSIDNFIDALGLKLHHTDEGMAYYNRTRDYVTMPKSEFFDNAERYYSTLLHEITHWTGHESRLNRPVHTRQFDKDYCFEELVAELGAMFLCSHFGVELTNNRHPEYIKSFLEALNNDKKLLWKAASQAQGAFDYLLDSVLVKAIKEVA